MRNKIREKLLLILSLLLVIFIPLLGSLVKWDGNIPGYGEFPAVQSKIPVPGFSVTIFTIGVIAELILLVVLVFPSLIGFKKPPKESQNEITNTTNYPPQLFFTVWLNPVLIMGAMLGLLGMWNVFTPLKNGDWSKLILIGIAMILSGLIWEFNNFGSEKFYDYKPINPSYWKYSIPYVNYIHMPFSEMPILGYLGYIPYAWICWIQWSLAANLFEFDESISLEDNA